MKKYGFAILFIALTTNLFSQNIVLPLWENKLPNQNETTINEIIDKSNAIRISEVSNPTIEVFLPSRVIMTGEAVIICPGGGYQYVVYDKEGTDIAKLLNAQGIAAIVLKYRLPSSQNNIDGRLSPFLDAQRAVRLIRYNAKEWGIDADKIGIMGFSAGGHLASTLGTHFNEQYFTTDKIDSISCRPDFMILVYPVITFKEPYLHLGSRTNLIGSDPSQELIEHYSNELQISADTPPTFLVHAQDDGAVPVENSIMFFENLRINKVPSEMHIFQEGGHGFGLATKKVRLVEWQDLCISWIKELDTK